MRKGTQGNAEKSSNLRKLDEGDHSDQGMKLLKSNKDQHTGLKTTIYTLNWPNSLFQRTFIACHADGTSRLDFDYDRAIGFLHNSLSMLAVIKQ
ncbi:hypothetical protein RIF29_23146 [Crotalaria pallida]|uniref:Uncharacterized protein n=1 Tax=Crotalaria pallida TaxID=3830 RepID=A0AAN9F794_CROPI